MTEKITQIPAQVQAFLTEVVDELKKVNWTSSAQLYQTTKVVIVSTLLLAAYFGVVDFLSSAVLNWFLTVRL